MTTARANEIIRELKELQKSRPDELDTESNKLFEAIMKIADERDKSLEMIDLMSEQLAGLTIWNNNKEEPLILGNKEEVKKYYFRKVEEDDKD